MPRLFTPRTLILLLAISIPNLLTSQEKKAPSVYGTEKTKIIVGDSLAEPVVKDIAAKVAMSDTSVEIVLYKMDLKEALRKFDAGELDIVAASEPELRKLRPDGVKAAPFAGGALVFIVSAANKVGGLGMADIRKIYAGEKKNWSQLGGYDFPINAYRLNNNSALADHAFSILFEKGKTQFKTSFPLASEAEMRNLARDNVNALAYIGSPQLKSDSGAKILALDGVVPDEKNIASGAYPNSFRLVMLSKSPEKDVLFRKFIKSKKGEDLIRRHGFTPLPAE